MARSGRPLESYVLSVMRLGMAGLTAYFAATAPSPFMYLLSGLFLLTSLKGRNFASAVKWWISLALAVGIAIWLVWNLLRFDPPIPPASESGIVLYGMTGCMVAEVVALVSGRIRRVWSFCRPVERDFSDGPAS